MFHSEAESRAFFDAPAFFLALVAALAVAVMVGLFLTRTRVGRLVILVALFVAFAVVVRVLASVVRIALTVTGNG